MDRSLSGDHSEQRIREMAYHLWEKDGRPLGQAERHWEMAQSLAVNSDEQPAAPAKAAQVKKSEPKEKKSPSAKPRKSVGQATGGHAAH